MYSPVEQINSSTYPPLAALLTYGIVTLLQLPLEVPVLRMVQMGYVVLASLIGLWCWRQLREQLLPQRSLGHRRAWSALVLLTVFLAATSPDTSEWIHALHTDALSLLWSLVSFAVLLRYLRAPTRGGFLLLCAVPAMGFAIKQYLLIWAPIAFFTLLIDAPRDVRRLVLLTTVTTLFTATGVAVYYALWGPNYLFWVFEVVGGARSRIGFSAGGFEMSVPRAADHVLRAWAPLSAGFVGGWLLLRNGPTRRLTALWTPWLLLVAAEAMTSGTGWGALYHFGPAVTLGAVWLLVALPESWPEPEGRQPAWARSAWGAASLLLVFLALGAVPSGNRGHQRYWAGGLPDGSLELVRAIESEIDGMEPDAVLLDWGNWVWLDDSHLGRDRAIAMADFPTVGRYDLLEPLISRIRSQTYEKILVHGLDSPGLIYDWGSLERPTGIREALREHYVEVRTIPEFQMIGSPYIQFTGPVSVLVPAR